MRGKLPAYLSKDQRGNYHFRARVPKALQPHLRKSEIRRSLGTDSRREAVRLARAYRVQLDQKMAELEKREFKARTLILEGEKKITHADGSTEIIKARIERDEPTSETEENEHKDFLLRQLDREAAFKLEQKREADIHKAKLASIANATPATPPPTRPSLLLSAAIGRYVQEKINLGHWKPRTALQYETTLRDFLEIVCDKPITEITRKTITDFIETYRKLPPNRNKEFPRQND